MPIFVLFANLLLANRESRQGIELTNTDFAINFDDYVSNENWNHIAMPEKYKGVMENALRNLHPYINDQEFIDEKNRLGSSWNWDKFYEYISWQGLQGTELYDEHVSNLNYEYESNIYLIDPVSGLYQTTKQPNCEE